MARRILGTPWSLVVLIFLAALSADAQSFRVQCPTSTIGTDVQRPDGIYDKLAGVRDPDCER